MQQDVIKFKSDDFEVTVRTTDDLQYSWQRFCGRVSKINARTYCRYTTDTECEFDLYDIEKREFSSIGKAKEWENLWPVVFETNSYQISIKFDIGIGDFKVLHIRKDVADSFYTDEQKLIGNVDFLNNPGLFRLEFEYVKDGKLLSHFVSFEVCSPKLDTRNDYKSILRAVNDEYEDIIYRYFATTLQQFSRGRIRNNVTWMQAFEQVIDDYLKQVKFIAANPHIKTCTHTLYRRADHIKHWWPWMEEQYEDAREEKRLEERYFGYEEYENSIDTLENRFVKHTLSKIGDQLKDILDKVLCNNSDELSADYRQKWVDYRNKIVRLQRHPFFKSIGRFSGMAGESLVLQNRQGYRQIYKDWLKLRRGIDLYNGRNNIGTLQIWEIYELWCFVKMKHLVRDIFGINPNEPEYEQLVKEPKGTLLNPFTDSELEHVVEFRYPTPAEDDPSERAEYLRAHAGDIVSLQYQHVFNRVGGKEKNDDKRTATTEQRPDIVLDIRKANGDIVLTYLYDAKYRVISDKKLDKDFEKEDIEEHERLGGDYPPSDAINQMHRYRDAIYYGTKQNHYASKEIIGGYILFPGRGDDETLMERYFSQSIESVNIGAFPLLPSNDKEKEGSILRNHLEEILLKKTVTSEHIEKSIPQRGLKYIGEKEYKELVLIAPTRNNIEKFNWCIAQNKYPIPLPKAHEEGVMSAKYAVLHCSAEYVPKRITKGKVQIMSKADLEKAGYPSPSEDYYLVLSLNDRVPKEVIFSTEKIKALGTRNSASVFVVEMNEICEKTE